MLAGEIQELWSGLDWKGPLKVVSSIWARQASLGCELLGKSHTKVK